MNRPTFHIYGDSALLVNFEQKIAPETNRSVIALSQAVEAAQIRGVRFCVPAYCSLTIGYNSRIIRYDKLCQLLELMASRLEKEITSTKNRTLRIPVCYEEPYALDFPDLSRQTGLSRQEIIHLHTTTLFRVYMLGFLPGFAYMGRLPEALYCTRKTTPRLRIPAQSVGTAGYQTGIYPSQAPGGWQIIGRTPIKIFDGEKENPFLFQAGDRINFQAISNNAFKQIEQEISSGVFKLETLIE